MSVTENKRARVFSTRAHFLPPRLAFPSPRALTPLSHFSFFLSTGVCKIVPPNAAAGLFLERVLRGEIDGSNPLDPSPTFKTRLQPVAAQEWKAPLNTAIWWEVGKPHTLASYEAEATKYAKSVFGSALAMPPVRAVEAELWRARSAAR